MSKTKIDWCDEVWNPVTGCSKISEGCKNCYAEKNGKQMYEGDRITYTGHYASGKLKELMIKYDEINACWRAFYCENEGHILSMRNAKNCEIIGNVHEVGE